MRIRERSGRTGSVPVGRAIPALLALLLPLLLPAIAAADPSQVMSAMEAELSRSMEVLKGQKPAPYFLSYEIVEVDQSQVASSFGTITSSGGARTRNLLIDVRVGDYALDSTHQLRGDPMSDMGDRLSTIEIPLDDNPDAIRSILWYETDRAFKRAQERYTKIETQMQVKVDEEDRSGDFSSEAPASYDGAAPPLAFDRAAWEGKLRRYTLPFADHDRIYEGDARLNVTRSTRWFVSSEGARIRTGQSAIRLAIMAGTKADDGMELPVVRTYFSYTVEGMPDDAAVLSDVARMIDDAEALRTAPLVDPYAGPAILSGRASAVYFHEIFGHRVEGHRQRDEGEGQTFKKMIDQQVLPPTFSVVFDPTVRQMAGSDLGGYYEYDDQGVAGQKVVVVDHGTLKGFLMSRKPIEGFASSNGHSRCQPGFAPVSRQSNLIVQVDDPVPTEQLKQMLIERIKAEGKPFGLIFDDIAGGFTMTGRMLPNAFNVTPLVVHRIYPDGREEMVRGVDLIGTPLTSFSRIVAADDQPDVFNGRCGAESGLVPVSAVSPAVLLSQIEVQKKEKSQERLPVLPAPRRKTLEP